MIKLTDKQIIEFFRRSYTSVDGLWFMKTEERDGFDAALQIDKNVWEIMPKIQARILKSMIETKDELHALMECLTTRLFLEGFSFIVKNNDDDFSIIIDNCPWHNLMVKSKRENLSGQIGSVICNNEYGVWAKEFGDNITFTLNDQICKGSKLCFLTFSR